MECFTPGHGPNSRLQWHRVADMLEPRSNFSVVVMEGRLVVTGGYRQEEGEEGSVCAEVEVYCPAANRFPPQRESSPLHPPGGAVVSRCRWPGPPSPLPWCPPGHCCDLHALVYIILWSVTK